MVFQNNILSNFFIKEQKAMKFLSNENYCHCLDKSQKYSIINYVIYFRRKNMIAKMWKKVLLIIVLLACLFNIVNKFVFHPSLEKELQSSAQYVLEQENANNK